MCDLGRLISIFKNDMQKNIQCNLMKINKIHFNANKLLKFKLLYYDYYLQNIFIFKQSFLEKFYYFKSCKKYSFITCASYIIYKKIYENV
jgi:hypothetical protein